MSEELYQQRRKSSTKPPELIEKDGKTVSRTSTGKRKFHNKSKLGCDTCKKRRVKCDETKPICNKCANMGIECHYTIPLPSNNQNKLNPRPKRSSITSHTKDKITSDLNSIADELKNQQESNYDVLKYDNRNDLNSFPTFTVGSPTSDNSTLRSTMLLNDRSNDRSSINSINNNPILNSNESSNTTSDNDGNLSINLNSLSTNPTISPQPSMSPRSATSQMSTHHAMNGRTTNHTAHSHHNNIENDYLPEQMQSLMTPYLQPSSLNLIDLRLMYHYTKVVAPTITTAGISEEKIWSEDIPNLSFNHPFLMHSVLAFSATHLSRTYKSLDQNVTYHRGEALRLLREAVLDITSDNTDALVASALILIMDSLANASLPTSLSPTSLPASAWIFHVKGAATILTAVWPLPPTSRFYKFISVDLSDLGDIINEKNESLSELVCFDESIADLYPVGYDSPYLITLAYLDKLNHEKFKSDFILRIFAFPALLDKTFLALLMSGDLSAMRIMRSYYSLLRDFTTEMKDKVWFLEGVSKVLPADVDDYTGGGGMHMMLDFLGGGLPSMTTTNLAPGLNIDINDHFMNP
ncbi:hypothetical protein WICMUC_004518 [Wickerhamomyces mucosus]|uniref:Zn(2)-C6 fungal-type domain-containing protein n=1 Tax=Wickerhamomyces mucosus TaxID=1378264 RepID=A0A9P8PHD9_9ASCO|nr:hypothetical protein WICMUC_004518 [Wickerhamomyces mucosus]